MSDSGERELVLGNKQLLAIFFAAAPMPAAPFQNPAQVKASSTPPASAAATGIFVSIPEKGASYVQVTAAARPNAEVLVKTFRDARLPAILTASSKPDLYRVMVG